MIHGYTMDALEFDSYNGTWSLRSDYDHTQHRVEFNFSDDDTYLDGDAYEDEVGDDTNQTVIVNDTSGNLIASGQYYDEMYYKLEGPGGEIFYLEVIEINGVAVGIATTTALSPGVSYPEIDSGNVVVDEYEDTRIQYSDLDDIPCFCQGSHLMTDQGEQAVDWIRAGDRVLTKDNGYQTVIWTARSVITVQMLKSNPKLRPVKIAARGIDGAAPAQDLLLSPEHRVLLASAQIELLFGCDEMFAAAKFICDGDQVAQILPEHEISYYHILFENHEAVLADGLWVESFFTGDMALGMLPASKQGQIRDLLGDKVDSMKTARPCLKSWEAAMLIPQSKAKATIALSAA